MIEEPSSVSEVLSAYCLKPQVGKTSVLTWIKLHKCLCKVHHVNECYKQLFNLAQGHNAAISQGNQIDQPMPLNIDYRGVNIYLLFFSEKAEKQCEIGLK